MTPQDPAPRPVRRALLSVSDKTGLVEFATGLAERGVELVASGRNREGAASGRVSTVLDVALNSPRVPEMLGGRVKTLHPRVHGGILARRDHEG